MTVHGSNADYFDFLCGKQAVAQDAGFVVSLEVINPLLKPHQKDIVIWAVRKGRAAVFASFGLGKTFMQLEIARLICEHTGGRFLIICPLGVRQEFMRDAEALGITITFVRRLEECGPTGIYLTNYETVRDGKLDPREFIGASLDEAAALRGFGGTKTFREFMRIFENQMRYKFVATATPSPNDYIELLAYSAFLDVMDVSAAKTRFFKRDSTQADHLTIHPHKQKEFYLWLSTWAIFIQKPEDICRCECHKEKNSKGDGSESSLSNHGSQKLNEEHGSVDATAEIPTLPPQITYSAVSSSVVDAYDQSTVEPEQEPSPSGRVCSTAAAEPHTRIGRNTEGGGFPSANDGASSATSSQTWGSLHEGRQSSELITTGTTSPETVDGQPARAPRPRCGTQRTLLWRCSQLLHRGGGRDVYADAI